MEIGVADSTDLLDSCMNLGDSAEEIEVGDSAGTDFSASEEATSSNATVAVSMVGISGTGMDSTGADSVGTLSSAGLGEAATARSWADSMVVDSTGSSSSWARRVDWLGAASEETSDSFFSVPCCS